MCSSVGTFANMNGEYREAAPYYVEVWLKYPMHMKLPFYFESITHYVAFCYLLLLSSATSPWRWAAFQESMDMPPFFRCLKTQPGCQSTKNFRPVSNLPLLSRVTGESSGRSRRSFLTSTIWCRHISLPTRNSIAPRQRCCGSTMTLSSQLTVVKCLASAC